MAKALGLLLTLGSGGLLFVTIALAGTPSRVRVPVDIVRVVIKVLALVTMAVVTSISMSPLFGVAILVGGIVGFVQGSSTILSERDGMLIAERSALGMAVFGVGIVFMQFMAILNRSGAISVGQTIGWFGAGIAAGVIAGRHKRLDQMPKAPSAVAAMALVGLGAAVIVGILAEPGAAQENGVWVRSSPTIDDSSPDTRSTMFAAGGYTVIVEAPSNLQATFVAEWTEPPAQIAAGETVPIALSLTGSVTREGTGQASASSAVAMRVGDSRSNVVVAQLDLGCGRGATGAAGELSCSGPTRIPKTGSVMGDLVLGTGSDGDTTTVFVFEGFCGNCRVEWTYNFQGGAAPVDASDTEVTEDAVTEDAVTEDALPVDVNEPEEDVDVAGTSPPAEDSAGVTDARAVTTSVIGLIALILLGAIDMEQFRDQLIGLGVDPGDRRAIIRGVMDRLAESRTVAPDSWQTGNMPRPGDATAEPGEWINSDPYETVEPAPPKPTEERPWYDPPGGESEVDASNEPVQPEPTPLQDWYSEPAPNADVRPDESFVPGKPMGDQTVAEPAPDPVKPPGGPVIEPFLLGDTEYQVAPSGDGGPSHLWERTADGEWTDLGEVADELDEKDVESALRALYEPTGPVVDPFPVGDSKYQIGPSEVGGPSYLWEKTADGEWTDVGQVVDGKVTIGGEEVEVKDVWRALIDLHSSKE